MTGSPTDITSFILLIPVCVHVLGTPPTLTHCPHHLPIQEMEVSICYSASLRVVTGLPTLCEDREPVLSLLNKSLSSWAQSEAPGHAFILSPKTLQYPAHSRCSVRSYCLFVEYIEANMIRHLRCPLLTLGPKVRRAEFPHKHRPRDSTEERTQFPSGGSTGAVLLPRVICNAWKHFPWS